MSRLNVHQKQGLGKAIIAHKVRSLGVYRRCSVHCRKRWENLRHWTRMMVEVQLRKTSQCGRGARWTLTLQMAHILAVAYPELEGQLRAQQQLGGASTMASRGDRPDDVGEAAGLSASS
ncbi:uncharacterized protein LOC144791324 [Lissotriton helveticus]